MTKTVYLLNVNNSVITQNLKASLEKQEAHYWLLLKSNDFPPEQRSYQQ